MSDCIAEMCRENTRLRAENERLREALKPVVDEANSILYEINGKKRDKHECLINVNLGCLCRAKEAYENTK